MHDFIFETRKATWGLIEVKSTHGKTTDMVINASKFEDISGDLFIVDCTIAVVWIMLVSIDVSEESNHILAADKAHVGHCRVSAVCGLTHVEATLGYDDNLLQNLRVHRLQNLRVR